MQFEDYGIVYLTNPFVLAFLQNGKARKLLTTGFGCNFLRSILKNV
jgi:hypothetical protein